MPRKKTFAESYSWDGKPVIFVFGSNLSGVHGAGAAKAARNRHGAEMGVGVGPTGAAYALPTKGYAPRLPTLSVEEISRHAKDFKDYAVRCEYRSLFQLTAVGCGLAGHHPRDIAPLFADCPNNVLLPPEWRSFLDRLPDERFWRYGQFKDS